jgi:hypothetical protein
MADLRFSKARISPLVDSGVSCDLDVLDQKGLPFLVKPVLAQKDVASCLLDRLRFLLSRMNIPLVLKEACGEPGAASLGSLDVGLSDAICPALTASFQQLLLRPALGTMFPACMHGSSCMGFSRHLKDQNKTPDATGFALIALMSPDDYTSRAGGRFCRATTPRPCLLCYRTSLFDLVIFLQSIAPDSVAFRFGDVVLQTHRSSWDCEDGFSSEFKYAPPVSRPLCLCTAMLRPALLFLGWKKDNRGWYVDQSSLEWHAEDKHSRVELGSHFCL